jgi:predicted transcriptional regulator
MQRLEPKPAARRLLILDRSGQILDYRPEGPGDRLGPLEKRILSLLLGGPLYGAEISRRLGAWHNNVHVSLGKLSRKGLVESWTALGDNLAGTRILRRFYALSPEKVSVAIPVKTPTRIELQRAKERAQIEGIQRELQGLRLQRELSLKPTTRLKALTGRSWKT